MTVAHFNFMFAYDSKLSRSLATIKMACCYATLYRNASGVPCRHKRCILQGFAVKRYITK